MCYEAHQARRTRVRASEFPISSLRLGVGNVLTHSVGIPVQVNDVLLAARGLRSGLLQRGG
jgi:hypothetical protein